MKSISILLGALLVAAPPLFCERPGEPSDSQNQTGFLLKFTLEESFDQVRARVGKPTQIAAFGPNFVTWQYQVDMHDHHEFSHLFCFGDSDRKLVSVTQNFEEARNVDAVFPAAQTTVHHWPDDRKPQFSIRVRRLSGNRLLMAMGASKPGQPINQLVLIRASVVGLFHPWLATQLTSR
ncbi:MAG: hypothetical protein ACKV22_36440 [Bryobacteraceae bacterium]